MVDLYIVLKRIYERKIQHNVQYRRLFVFRVIMNANEID